MVIPSVESEFNLKTLRITTHTSAYETYTYTHTYTHTHIHTHIHTSMLKSLTHP